MHGVGSDGGPTLLATLITLSDTCSNTEIAKIVYLNDPKSLVMQGNSIKSRVCIRK